MTGSFRLAHLSDLHFGADVPEVSHAVAEKIRTLKPDMILITGDITQRARRAQFRAARKFLDELRPIPMISIPGNHDIPLFNIAARLFYPYWGYTRFFKGSLQGMFQQSGVEILTLNSTYKFRHVQGQLPLDELEEALSQFNQACHVRVVAFHHPMDCLKSIDEKNLLLNALDAIHLFSKYKVDLIVGGHIHDPVTRSTRHRYPELTPAFIISVCGTTTSYRVRRNAPNSFNIYDWKKGVTEKEIAMHFQRFEFVKEDNSFYCKTHQDFARSESGEWS